MPLDPVIPALDEVRSIQPVARSPQAPAPRVTVIVPVLNEEARIGDQLDALGALEDLHEIIVVDGGSVDRTVDVVRAEGLPGAFLSL